MPSPDDLQQINDLMMRSQKLTLESPVREPFDQWRDAILMVSKGVLNLKSHPVLTGDAPPPTGANTGEAHANIMLAYRHLEDARMRIGKAIQALEGGVSIYDQKKP